MSAAARYEPAGPEPACVPARPVPGRSARPGGFTLVETMVALIVLGIIGVAMAEIFRAQHQAQGRQNTGVERTMNARAAMDMMAREIRNAGYDPRGTAGAGFVKTNTSEVEWTADLNGDGDTDDSTTGGDEHVAYSLDVKSQSIVRVSNGVETVVADHVTALEFTYLDEDLEVTFDGDRIEQVNITMAYETPRGTSSGALETQVAVRNRIFMMKVCATNQALAVDGDLEIEKGSYLGCAKSLHSNGDLKLHGDITVAGSVTTSGSLDNGATLKDEEGNTVEPESGAGSVDVEKISNPTSSHCDDADYLLKSTGKIEELANGTEHDATSSAWRGWKRTKASPVVYTYDTDNEYPGTYCVEGNAEIKKNPGKNEGSAMAITIVAKGSIKVDADPWLTADDPSGYLFVAGGDVKIKSGEMGALTNYTGDIYAYSQCDLDGKMKLASRLVCGDNATPGHAEEWADKNKVKEVKITYACSSECD